MRVERRDDGWWIVDAPPYEVDGAIFTSYGPYATRAEAREDKAGLSEFFRRCPPPAAEDDAVHATESTSEQIQLTWTFADDSDKKSNSVVRWRSATRRFHLAPKRPIPPSPDQLTLPGLEDSLGK